MQDGYHFAAAPWLIGDGRVAGLPDAADPADTQARPVPDLGVTRRGQIVRIVHEPQPSPPLVMLADDVAKVQPAPPVVLTPADRLWAAEAVLPDAGIAVVDPTPDAKTTLSSLFAALFDGLAQRQDAGLAQIAAVQSAGLERILAQLAVRDAPLSQLTPDRDLADRVELTLATLAQSRVDQADALHEIATRFDALTDRIMMVPHQQDRLLRDVADLRSSLTELRVQLRLIEWQAFAAPRAVPGQFHAPASLLAGGGPGQAGLAS